MTNSNIRIGCDIDGVVVDTPGEWGRWLEAAFYRKLPERVSYNYDLTTYFSGELEKFGMDGKEFWRDPNLYDKLSPIQPSVSTLKYFKEKGCEVVFISSLKGNHHKSKVGFIKRHFPFYDAFLGTKEKGYVNVDMMIDDRVENLHQFGKHVVKVLLQTPYQQTAQMTNDIVVAKDWEDVYNIINEQLEIEEYHRHCAEHFIIG